MRKPERNTKVKISILSVTNFITTHLLTHSFLKHSHLSPILLANTIHTHNYTNSPQLQVFTSSSSSSSESSSASGVLILNNVSNKNFPLRFVALAINLSPVLLLFTSLLHSSEYLLPFGSQFDDAMLPMYALTVCTWRNLFNSTTNARENAILLLNCVYDICFAFIFLLFCNSFLMDSKFQMFQFIPSLILDSVLNFKRSHQCNRYFFFVHFFFFCVFYTFLSIFFTLKTDNSSFYCSKIRCSGAHTCKPSGDIKSNAF